MGSTTLAAELQSNPFLVELRDSMAGALRPDDTVS
jgi:hypothetical protein